MPPLALLLPIACPIGAGVIAAVAGRYGTDMGRIAAGFGTWAAVIAIVALWLPVRSTEELSLGQLGFGTGLDLRLDGVAVVFGLIILVPAAMLLSIQRRTWQESAVAAFGVAAAVLAIEAGGVLLTAFAGCTAATLAVIQLDIEDPRAPRPSWALMLAAWLALAWAGVILQVIGGTAVYVAVPVAALTTPVFMVLAFSAIFASGLFPWRGWATQLWARPSLRAAGIVVLTVQPLGLYLLVRAYEMGNGRYPQVTLNVLLALWGVLVAFGAAARAQSASSRREYMAEVLPGLAGFAMMSVAVGTALGLVAALILLASAAILAVCLPLLPERGGPASLLVVAAAVGVPPGIAFGGRLLGLDAALEAGGAMGLIGLGGIATWLLSAAAAARSVGLPSARQSTASNTSPRLTMVLAGLAMAAGPALGLAFFVGATAASDVITVPSGTVGPFNSTIVTVSTVLPVVALLGPLFLVGAIAIALARPGRPAPRAKSLAPLFPPYGAATVGRLREQMRAATMPDEYRSLLNPRALEAAAAAGTPLLWLASLVALAFVVTR